jgi:hypothetical protein
MAQATDSVAPGSVPKSIMVPPLYRNAWENPPMAAYPTTCPLSLTAVAEAPPPSVPKSTMVPPLYRAASVPPSNAAICPLLFMLAWQGPPWRRGTTWVAL